LLLAKGTQRGIIDEFAKIMKVEIYNILGSFKWILGKKVALFGTW